MTPIILRGDARNLPLADASVDAIVCDPPYALPGGFMGKTWDRFDEPRAFQEWCETWAREALRVLKPGGHMLAFGGSRTWHRLTCAIEDAGFEIRDSIGHGHMAWTYGQGFAKGIDVSKAIDKQRDDRADIVRVTTYLAEHAEALGITRADVDAYMGTSDMGGWWLTRLQHRCQVPTWEQWQRLRDLIGFGDEMDAEVWRLNGRKGTPGEAWEMRELVGTGYRIRRESDVQVAGISGGEYPITAPATTEARRWQGWNTSLKPAWEPIVMARKPLIGTVVANVLRYGTGAFNIDGCRIGDESRTNHAGGTSSLQRVSRVEHGYRSTVTASQGQPSTVTGRWPTNVVLSHAPLLDEHGEVIGDACADGCVPGCPVAELDAQSGVLTSGANPTRRGSDKFRDAYGDFKGQAECVPARGADSGGASRFFPTFHYEAKAPTDERPRVNGVAHPTVKPLGLLRWMVRLVTPPDGLVLDMFAGSGTTVEAALLEGFRVVGIERDADYLPLIQHRVDRARRRLQPGVARLAKTKPPAQADGQGDLLADLFGGAA